MMRPESFGKVAVFCGGRSRERDISLQSGAAVHEALVESGIDASLVDVAEIEISQLSAYDTGFIALHGRDGEDGKFQSLLEYIGMPYTGSRVAASSLSMNKWSTKAVWESIGLPTPPYRVVDKETPLKLAELEYPVYVKPVNEGSSIGVTRVESEQDLAEAITEAHLYDDVVLIEQAISGLECTFSYIEGCDSFPLIALQPTNEFYDYEAKYLRDDTEYVVSPKLNAEVVEQCIAQAKLAFRSLGMQGWGRIDFFVDESGAPWFIEANSVPGMTNHSLVPKAAGATGMSFSDTCLAILQTASLSSLDKEDV